MHGGRRTGAAVVMAAAASRMSLAVAALLLTRLSVNRNTSPRYLQGHERVDGSVGARVVGRTL